MHQKLSTSQFILSQVLILILSLIFIGGLYYYLNFETKLPTNSFSLDTPLTKEPATLSLDIISPDDEVLVFDDDLEITGKTNPNLIVLVSSKQRDKVSEAKSGGNFSVDFKLDPGINYLQIVVFDNGEQKSLERTVYYSKEKI